MTVSGLTGHDLLLRHQDQRRSAERLGPVQRASGTTTPDVTAPAAVSNLAAGSPTSSSLTLTWTAPGDDGSTGTAATYDIRYSTSTINDGNWASATQVTGEPAPAAAGTGQNMIVSGLSANTTYYFAMKTSDEVPNTSALSNVASRHDQCRAQPPVTVLHSGLNISGWRGGTEISSTYCFIDNWPNANADGTLRPVRQDRPADRDRYDPGRIQGLGRQGLRYAGQLGDRPDPSQPGSRWQPRSTSTPARSSGAPRTPTTAGSGNWTFNGASLRRLR